MTTITVDLRAREATDEATRLLGQIPNYAMDDDERRDVIAHAQALAALAVACRLNELIEAVGALAQTVAEASPR